MLSIKANRRLEELGLGSYCTEDFTNGVKLLQLICHVYCGGDNSLLSSKIKWLDEQKTGNQVININRILNFIKNDPGIRLPPAIRELTAFRLIEDGEAMLNLVVYLLGQLPAAKSSNNQMSPPRQHENQLDNLYFAASIEKHNGSEDSLEAENRAETVVRKGSFKVLKPKVSSESKLKSADSDQLHVPQDESKMDTALGKHPLRQLYSVDQDNLSSEEPNSRKTVPKIYQRPPLYRSSQKESQENFKQKNELIQQKKPPFSMITASQTDRETIAKNIQLISHQILEQERSLNLLNSSMNYSKPEPPKAKVPRKIFKLDLNDIGESKKKQLVEWLIGINILSLSSAKYVFELHTICKDGVIFLEVINYYRGRGRDLCFFKDPKRSAEMHSNFQKLFSLLQQLPEFKSDLLNQYEYFIPEAQPNAFWNLLSDLNGCLCKEQKLRNRGINRYDDSVGTTVQRTTSRRKRINQSVSYQDLKFNSQPLVKEGKQVKTRFSSIELPRKQTPKPMSKEKSEKSHKSQESDQRNAPYGLIQKEQPIEECVRTERGYKQMYLCKFKNMETPSKSKQFSNSSLSKSRMRSSAGSAKKNQQKVSLPSISLQMQMAVIKYLNSLRVDEDSQLFKDPYRNGTLLCMIIKKEWGIDCLASKRPSGIDDCRNNYFNAIETIKNKRKKIQVTYQSFVEELVKGEKSLLYGLIWNILKQEEERQPFSSIEIDGREVQRSIQGQEEKISWIRSIERKSADIAAMKIRSEQALYQTIVNTDFLFHYAWFITGKKAVTPNYERPFNSIQKQSNLKKALSYLVQNKIIRSDYLWKSKCLLKREGTLEDLVNDLVAHYNRLFQKEQMRTVNFIRYIKREDSEQQRQKPQEKLETTMANQTILQNPHVSPTPPLQINWMRRLGFRGSLQLNNGVILCRLVAKLGMKTIDGVNQNPQSRAECLGNIRRAVKHLPKFRWDEYDIVQGDYSRSLEVYSFLRDQFKHSYALKSIL